jgi:hypothetical protein
MKNGDFNCCLSKGNHINKVLCLSLSGCYLQGHLGPEVGDHCETVLCSQDPLFNNPLHLSARIVRIDEHGTALEFCDIDENGYLMLQTILLYHSDEPCSLAAEFPASQPFKDQSSQVHSLCLVPA